jgi:hypothetical protein
MGKAQRESRNEGLRANGVEPEPGPFAGVKRWARYIARGGARKVVVKNPRKYLHASRGI